MRRCALLTGYLVISASVFIAVAARSAKSRFSRSLIPSIPAASAGWEVHDTPLGPTELATGEAERALDFDEYFYKTYQKGNFAVRIYVAYWGPGKIDPLLVISHNPDNCWVGAGGTILSSRNGVRIPGLKSETSVPGAFRAFQFQSAREEVVFWYLYGSQTVELQEHKLDTLRGRIRLFAQMLNVTHFGFHPKDQVFVRISTNGSFQDILKTDLWKELVTTLTPLGIFPSGG